MKVSRQFLKDFAEIANRYGWDADDIEEVKTATRGDPKLLRYWTALAAAHRQGYQQTRANNYMRLTAWLEANNQSNLLRENTE